MASCALGFNVSNLATLIKPTTSSKDPRQTGYQEWLKEGSAVRSESLIFFKQAAAVSEASNH